MHKILINKEFLRMIIIYYLIFIIQIYDLLNHTIIILLFRRQLFFNIYIF